MTCLLVLGQVRGQFVSADPLPGKAFADSDPIDGESAIRTTKELLAASSDQRKKQIAAITADSSHYAPPVLYALSSALFEEGRKDEAAFWFYAGQLRGRFDANRCNDISARQGVAVLNQTFGTPINQYMFKDLPKLKALIPRVVEWDRTTPYNYDHRWINLHGIGVMEEDGKGGKKTTPSAPREQWAKIAEETRAAYLQQFEKAMELVQKQR
jgi:hypothetical protein